ncbi:hypothetical protein B0T21DRAFT_414965 [Apiosordaria backusii]|uniref:Fungal N-terminal domain-containing protein n=1 Tax=Apiosordaria backusii TaxID=314023 RepID=A0AA40AN74_9PEZI|nr:hypothetical protein B0T21DRAFT_414965 [Apiosordaria backusii]
MAELPAILGAAATVTNACAAIFRRGDRLRQASVEVEDATEEVCDLKRRVNELIDLCIEHRALLTQTAPTDHKTIDAAISRAWKGLQEVQPVIERNITREGRVGKYSISRITRPIWWYLIDRNEYQRQRNTILRNNDEVYHRITQLQQLVHFNSLTETVMLSVKEKKEEEEEKEEEERRRLLEEWDARQERLDSEGLQFLSPVPVVDEVVPSP